MGALSPDLFSEDGAGNSRKRSRQLAEFVLGFSVIHVWRAVCSSARVNKPFCVMMLIGPVVL